MLLIEFNNLLGDTLMSKIHMNGIDIIHMDLFFLIIEPLFQMLVAVGGVLLQSIPIYNHLIQPI